MSDENHPHDECGNFLFSTFKVYGNCLDLQIPEFLCLWDLLIMANTVLQMALISDYPFSYTLPARSEKGFFFLHTVKFIQQKLTLHSSSFKKKGYLLILSEKLGNSAYL